MLLETTPMTGVQEVMPHSWPKRPGLRQYAGFQLRRHTDLFAGINRMDGEVLRRGSVVTARNILCRKGRPQALMKSAWHPHGTYLGPTAARPSKSLWREVNGSW